jgi:hypothetical protein
MKITLTLKSVYGQTRAYPACSKAQGFANLLGTKTLTRQNLRHIEALGFTIETAADAKLEDVL